MKFINKTELAEHFGAPRAVIEAVMTELKLAPVYSMPQGKGKVDLFNFDDVVGPIEAALKARRTKRAEKAEKAMTATMDPALTASVEGLAQRIDASLDEAAETNAGILSTMKTLIEQNRALLRMLEDIRGTTYAKIDGLQAAFDALPVQAVEPPAPVVAALAVNVTPPPAPATKNPVPTVKARLPRIAVVGLLNDQKHMIEREFGDAFDLRMYDSDAAKGKGFSDVASNCRAVVVMTAFMNNGIESAVKAAGSRLVRVNGGMTGLRNTLTELFVSLAAKA